MNGDRPTSIIFATSGIYDGLLGVIFLLFGEKMYAVFNVTPPNHWGYVRFGAIILIIFAIMFFEVAAKPRASRNLIPYGIMLKVAYFGTVYAYWFLQGLPFMWKPFAIADTVFAGLFYWAWRRTSVIAAVPPA